MSRQSDLFLPCEGPPSLLVASGGARPIKVALFHLHGNSRYCRQQTSLGTSKRTNCLVSEAKTLCRREPLFIIDYSFLISVYVCILYITDQKSNMTPASF